MFALFAWAAFLLAAIPALLFVRNLMLYRRPIVAPAIEHPSVSVLIPARNEEASIEAAVRTALASEDVDLEVIVLDDHSTDRTAAIVRSMSLKDDRLRVAAAPLLPEGWCGKQFACFTLSQLAAKPLLCFVDADVRLAPDGLSRLIFEMKRRHASLLSGFPHQETRTTLERLLIPLMHFLLLGFLPLGAMRKSKSSAFAAGCGQLMLADRRAYLRAGTHNAIRDSKHDGITLPKAFRRAGMKTDLCDATTIATCRMYTNARDVLRGLTKNATEGIAAPTRIVPFTLLLFGGQVLPFLLLFLQVQRALLFLAIFFAYLPRLLAVARFRQSLLGAIFHPVSIVLLLVLQWWALMRQLAGAPSTWKGRDYPAPSAS